MRGAVNSTWVARGGLKAAPRNLPHVRGCDDADAGRLSSAASSRRERRPLCGRPMMPSRMETFSKSASAWFRLSIRTLLPMWQFLSMMAPLITEPSPTPSTGRRPSPLGRLLRRRRSRPPSAWSCGSVTLRPMWQRRPITLCSMRGARFDDAAVGQAGFADRGPVDAGRRQRAGMRVDRAGRRLESRTAAAFWPAPGWPRRRSGWCRCPPSNRRTDRPARLRARIDSGKTSLPKSW